MLGTLSRDVRQYLLVTANYWAFTLTDGALRMLVVLHFHELGYSPLQIAMLFLFYEIFGVITNLFGGWLGAHIGLNRTMNIGLAIQILALLMLLAPDLTVLWVMAAQALSGIAKDLNKMSAKSAVKLLVPENAQGSLYRWVAFLTGSKNTLKGAGFFLGGFLLAMFGFAGAVAAMASALLLVWLFSLVSLDRGMGKAKNKPKFTELFSRSASINTLSAARLFLFGARDVWFVVALPVTLSSGYGWSHPAIGGFLASWVIAYGIVQSLAPWITGRKSGQVPGRQVVFMWAAVLALIPAFIAVGLESQSGQLWILLSGLMVFGLLFAINSSVHSYLIVSYARSDGVSTDVGFYYMANAMGRLVGTVLSGWVFQEAGLTACLWVSFTFLILASLISTRLPKSTYEKSRAI